MAFIQCQCGWDGVKETAAHLQWHGRHCSTPTSQAAAATAADVNAILMVHSRWHCRSHVWRRRTGASAGRACSSRMLTLWFTCSKRKEMVGPHMHHMQVPLPAMRAPAGSQARSKKEGAKDEYASYASLLADFARGGDF
eukprot:864763-Pelagomonas_calceolata.AAC.1